MVIFVSSIFNEASQRYWQKNLSNTPIINPYNDFFTHFSSYLGDKDCICILTGSDIRNESKFMVEIFKHTKIKVIFINYLELENNLEKVKNTLIISELSHEELLSLSKNILIELSNSLLLNDPRTIFLIHDKRFFSVMKDKELQEKVFTKEEIKEFNKFYIPTYSYSEHIDKWEDAKVNKSNWILKHRILGKSQQIYAGIVTLQTEWDDLFKGSSILDMVLQEWIPQKTIKGSIGNNLYNDYIAGTLLFFDNNFFGFGPFRASSFEVSNKIDDRKISSIILKNQNENR